MAFKLGIIGLGKIAQDQHLPVVAKNKRLRARRRRLLARGLPRCAGLQDAGRAVPQRR